MKKLPVARNENIVVQNLGDEILIYDLKTHKAYNLNETLSIVYKACDGKTSFAEVREKKNFTDEIIFLSLDELKRENLLEEDKVYYSPFMGISRREAIRKVGLASMISLPLISSLMAPTAAMAQSGSCAGATSGIGLSSGGLYCTTPVNGNNCAPDALTFCQSCSGTLSANPGCAPGANSFLCECS